MLHYAYIQLMTLYQVLSIVLYYLSNFETMYRIPFQFTSILYISDISLNEMSITNTFIYMYKHVHIYVATHKWGIRTTEQPTHFHLLYQHTSFSLYSNFQLSNFNTHTRERMNSTFMNVFIFPECSITLFETYWLY